MRAAIYNPYWDTLGGGERYTATFVKLLLDRGWKVDVIWPRDISAAVRDRFGIDISAARFKPSPSIFDHRLLFWLSDGSLPVSLARLTIIHFQFPFSRVSGASPLNLIKSRFYTFVANSNFTKEVVDAEYHIKSHVIYPPVDTKSLSAPHPKTNTILYVGRFSNLTQTKGHAVLIDTFKSISPRLPGWKLILAGGTAVGTSPADLQHLKDRSQGYPIEFLFDPDFPTLTRAYRRAKIFWSAAGFGVDAVHHPAQVEHFGISVVEAMAAGCVPAVTNVGGFKEIIINNHSGFLWYDTRQLAGLTVSLATRPQLLRQMQSEARSRSKLFSVAAFNSAFIPLIRPYEDQPLKG